MEIELGRRRCFEHDLCRLLLDFGASDEGLAPAVARATSELLVALGQSASDGQSLTPLDVVRIRANKFAALRLPPAVFRDPRALAALRAELLRLARMLLGTTRSDSLF
ncbi:MAG: hypothetical protein JWN48_4135 [Myxococcaceae bacterium]|nr:hypothetical protein [Myxococcaceae bacterium]